MYPKDAFSESDITIVFRNIFLPPLLLSRIKDKGVLPVL